ncbi:MAG: DUF1211 domain-containing protein [Bacteroidetes bacterium]|nr:DUF1211 domain-containing protein [Bacteroidota bacterium]
MNISTNRVEAFSDGVISIIITIMVFDIKFSHVISKDNFTQLVVTKQLINLVPKLITYVFSFLVVGIMWLNHHHLYLLLQRVDEKLLWLNLNLLFWLSLIPFPTSMLGGNPFLPQSTAIYGGVLFMATFSFSIMRAYAMRHDMMHKDDKLIQREIAKLNKRARVKNFLGMGAYLLSIPMAFVSIYISFACFTVMPILFFIPDGIEDEELVERIIDKNHSGGEDLSA